MTRTHCLARIALASAGLALLLSGCSPAPVAQSGDRTTALRPAQASIPQPPPAAPNRIDPSQTDQLPLWPTQTAPPAAPPAPSAAPPLWPPVATTAAPLAAPDPAFAEIARSPQAPETQAPASAAPELSPAPAPVASTIPIAPQFDPPSLPRPVNPDVGPIAPAEEEFVNPLRRGSPGRTTAPNPLRGADPPLLPPASSVFATPTEPAFTPAPATTAPAFTLPAGPPAPFAPPPLPRPEPRIPNTPAPNLAPLPPLEPSGGSGPSGGAAPPASFLPAAAPDQPPPLLVPPLPTPPPAPSPPVNAGAAQAPPIIPLLDESPPSPAEVAAALNNGPFKTVRVYYATDRRPASEVTEDWRQIAWRFAWAGLSLSLGVGLGLVALRYPSRPSFLACCIALAVTLGFSGHAGVHAWRKLRRPPAALHFSAERNPGGAVQYGFCDVTIPKNHERGRLEGAKVTRLEVSHDLHNHVTLRCTESLPCDDFFAAFNRQLKKTQRREVLVFIHGFNVTFEDAARRTGQLAVDLPVDGAAVFYSWPADRYSLLTYVKDEESVRWATPHLKQFLLDLAKRTDAGAINVVAHSMGNRALATALREIELQMGEQPKLFNQVVLAAPDIDVEDFRDNIAPAIQKTANRFTLYTSARDYALCLSRLVHRFRRVGDSRGGPLVAPGIDTIDVSNLDGGPWGHLYYGDSDPVLRDLSLVTQSYPTHKRTWLTAEGAAGSPYWVLRNQATSARGGGSIR